MNIIVLSPVVSSELSHIRAPQNQRAFELRQQFQQLGCPCTGQYVNDRMWIEQSSPQLKALESHIYAEATLNFWRQLVLKFIRDTPCVVFDFRQLGHMIPVTTVAVAYNAVHTWPGVCLLVDGPDHPQQGAASRILIRECDYADNSPVFTDPADIARRKRLQPQKIKGNRKTRRRGGGR